ncbi:MAG TPA: translocation/assembly module TamB domain-containing protein [Acidobacteriaceae bacterium]|nr:translocation/assembly module TamB domain-containing protein [Acidobacteriaceae bacterium]
MTEGASANRENGAAKTRRSRWRMVAYAVAAMLALVVALIGALVWYANTPQFAARVHHAVVDVLERTTGGRVEMRSFRWSLRHFAIEVNDLTIHGKEAAGEVPYFHVSHLMLHASILTLLSPKISLTSLTAESPTIHLIVYPDGTTNQPQPRVASQQPLPQALLSMAIDDTRVENGVFLLNNRKIPFNLAAGPIQLAMRYVSDPAEYQASLDIRNITFRLKSDSGAHSRLKVSLRLRRDAVKIENLDLETGNSRLIGSGELQNFSSPSWQANIRGSVDARQIGAMTGVDALRAGIAQLSIDAHGAANGTFQVSGHVVMRSGAWVAPWLTLRNVDLRTNIYVDNDTCSLTDFSSVLDDQGRIAGSMVLKHCVGPSAPVIAPGTKGKARPAESLRQRMSPRELLEHLHQKFEPKAAKAVEQEYQPLQADIEAQVSNVTLPLILAATAPRRDWNIGFTTAASGKVTVRWTGDGNGLDVHGDLMLSVPQHTLGLVPVSGPAHADYLGDHRHLVIQDANLHTPATQVHGAGTLDLLEKDLRSSLRLDVVGRDLGEFDQLLTITDLRATPVGAPHALPLKLLGSASFHGIVHGSFFALQAVGHLDSGPFEMVVERARQENAGDTMHERLLTWDQFHGDISYAPARLVVRNGELVRGNAVIHADLDLSPDRTAPDTYTYNNQTQVTATMQSTNASVADLQSVFGTSYPVAGTLDVHAHVAGTLDDLEGSGQVDLTHGVIDGQAIPSAMAVLAAEGHRLEATHVRIATAGGIATGHLSYDDASGKLQGELTGEHFELSQIALLENSRLKPDGTMGFHFQGGGTLAAPVATGAMQVENLTLNGRPMGRAQAETHYQGGILYMTSRAEVLRARLDMSGQVQLGGKYPAQMELTFADFNIDPLLRSLTTSGISAQSSLQGKITMSGPLAEPSAIQADADMNTFSVTIGNLPIHSEGPIEASLRDGKLQLKQVHLQGADMDLTAGGTIDLLRGYALRLHSEGTVNARLASVTNKALQSTGQVSFVVNVRGTVHQPNMQGRAQFSNINMHLQNITNGLTDMNGTMVFDQNRLVVQQLKGSSGGGELDVKGFIGYQNGIFTDLTVTSQGVRIRYPKGISSSVDAKLRVLGNVDDLLVSGNVQLMRFGVDSNIDLTSLAVGGGGVSTPIDPSSPLNRVHLDIHVTSAPQLGFQNSFASLAGDVNLRIRGTVENPSVLGRIDITEGSASFAGTKYQLQQGDIIFANPVTIAPEIDLEATAQVQNYDIIITLHGPPSKLEISYRSEPPLTQADVLALLALGRTNEQAAMYGEQQQAGANLTTEALLGGALNAAVSSRVQKLFGVGSVRVDPNFVGTLGESTARITVEQQVGRNLILTFATNVNTTAQQLIQGQLNLTRNVSIIAVRDEANVFSMYLQIRGRHQ